MTSNHIGQDASCGFNVCVSKYNYFDRIIVGNLSVADSDLLWLPEVGYVGEDIPCIVCSNYLHLTSMHFSQDFSLQVSAVLSVVLLFLTQIISVMDILSNVSSPTQIIPQ